MPELIIGYDPLQPIGSRLSPEIIAEIEIVAPSTVNDYSLIEAKYADESVSHRALALGAVFSVNIMTGEVKTDNLADNSVTDTKLAPGSVRPNAAGPGIPTIYDFSNNPISVVFKDCTLAEYASVADPDPDTYYLCRE